MKLVSMPLNSQICVMAVCSFQLMIFFRAQRNKVGVGCINDESRLTKQFMERFKGIHFSVQGHRLEGISDLSIKRNMQARLLTKHHKG
ncbi:hypothetical protein [Acetobacter persici]|uniref:hypothetical protein n=1 Tax=Acetobacter persici TaxID=1076596 RepID=UPI001FD50ECF|nr:hypothetical protein [Acetobacter persici]